MLEDDTGTDAERKERLKREKREYDARQAYLEDIARVEEERDGC